jgi:hypothetical protein
VLLKGLSVAKVPVMCALSAQPDRAFSQLHVPLEGNVPDFSQLLPLEAGEVHPLRLAGGAKVVAADGLVSLLGMAKEPADDDELSSAVYQLAVHGALAAACRCPPTGHDVAG